MYVVSSQIFGARIFGPPGAIFYTWVVCLSCLGALHATVYSAGRLTQAASSENYIPLSLLGRGAVNPSSPEISTDISTNTQQAAQASNRVTAMTRLIRLPFGFGLSDDPNVPV